MQTKVESEGQRVRRAMDRFVFAICPGVTFPMFWGFAGLHRAAFAAGRLILLISEGCITITPANPAAK